MTLEYKINKEKGNQLTHCFLSFHKKRYISLRTARAVQSLVFCFVKLFYSKNMFQALNSPQKISSNCDTIKLSPDSNQLLIMTSSPLVTTSSHHSMNNHQHNHNLSSSSVTLPPILKPIANLSRCQASRLG